MTDSAELDVLDGTIMLVADAAAFSTRDVWTGYLEGLVEVGANVLPYPTFSMLELFSPNLLGSDLIGKAVDIRNGVTAVVFVSGMYFRNSRSWVVESLTRRGIPTVFLATDDPYESINSRDVYSMRFSNELSCANGDIPYLPTATLIPPDLGSPPWVRDLVFVGTVFEDRLPMIQKIAMYCELNEYRFDIYGNFPSPPVGLDDLEFVKMMPGTVSAEEKWNLYSQSRMVLNVFRSHESQPCSASPRVYEVAAMGRPALITDRRAECDEIFGDSIYVFDDIDQFGAVLEEALQSESSRLDRVKRAQQIVERSHLYQHRALTLLEAIHAYIAKENV